MGKGLAIADMAASMHGLLMLWVAGPRALP